MSPETKTDRLVITVGTSLFTSASWRCEGPFAELKSYGRWCSELLQKPSERRDANNRTAGEIEGILRDWPEKALEAFAWPDDGRSYQPLRYSAEVSTLLRWMQQESGRELGEFLRQRYERVEIIAPSNVEDPARVVADHLNLVFRHRLGLSNVELVDALRSSSIGESAQHFRNYLGAIATAGGTADLVVSGGYKVYAMFAAVSAAQPALQGRWRVLYVHESKSQELIVQEKKEMRVGERKIPWASAETM